MFSTIAVQLRTLFNLLINELFNGKRNVNIIDCGTNEEFIEFYVRHDDRGTEVGISNF